MPVAWKVVTTDASLLGWGAVLEEATVQGKWSETEKALSFNILEIQGSNIMDFQVAWLSCQDTI